MDWLRGYFVRIIAVCLIAAVGDHLVSSKSAKAVVRFLSGAMILLVVISPILGISPERMIEELDAYLGNASSAQSFHEEYQTQLRKHIQSTTEEYIEEKARELGGQVQAVVTLTDEEYPTPCGVKIIGILGQEQKLALQMYLSDSIGIPMQAQQWGE